MNEKCGNCLDCVKVCPVKSFTGRNFDPNESREMRYNAQLCNDYFVAMTKKEQLPVCGMCLYICPYGKKKFGNNVFKK